LLIAGGFAAGVQLQASDLTHSAMTQVRVQLQASDATHSAMTQVRVQVQASDMTQVHLSVLMIRHEFALAWTVSCCSNALVLMRHPLGAWMSERLFCFGCPAYGQGPCDGLLPFTGSSK
jgi:hypothetical protein